jgi:hypothetical protein
MAPGVDGPAFRWDAYGISAYDFNDENNIINTKKFVRFDKNGIYGMDKKDGTGWHPKDLKEIQDNGIFALTWDGLFLNLGSAYYDEYWTDSFSKNKLETPIWYPSSCSIGKTENLIYNSWITDRTKTGYGLPYFDPSENGNYFVKIFSVKEAYG